VRGPAAPHDDREASVVRNRRAVAWLGFMVFVGAAWILASSLLGTVTGRARADGIIGVIVGLYVSSFPARHFVDLLVYWKTEGARFPTRRSLGWWIALNGFVLLVGWLVIVVAAARFTARPG
jgi:hypothetical protein